MLNESDPSERFRCPASGTPNRVRKDLHHYPRQIFPVKSLFACTCAWLSCQTGGFPGNRYDTSLFCSLLRPGNPSQFAGQKMVGDIEFGLRRGKSNARDFAKTVCRGSGRRGRLRLLILLGNRGSYRP
jgi:hypothetical protein